MRRMVLAALTLVLAAAPLAAQDPHFGLGLVLGFPTGALNSTTYADGRTEGYNTGVGVQFTASWPVSRSLALRVNVGGITFNGTGSTPSNPNWNLEEDLVSFAGEAEYFLPGSSVSRHLGTYLIGGLGLDVEHFSAGSAYSYAYGYDYVYGPTVTADRTRLAATAGIGHTFRSYGRYRWSLEAVYHKTLTDTGDTSATGVGYPSADFLKCSVGFGF